MAKASVTLLASQALAAATAVRTPETALSTFDGFKVFIRLTNGATAPTTAPVVAFYASDRTGATADKYLQYTASGDIVANSVTDITFRHDKEDMFAVAKITWGATTGGTVEAYAETYVK